LGSESRDNQTRVMTLSSSMEHRASTRALMETKQNNFKMKKKIKLKNGKEKKTNPNIKPNKKTNTFRISFSSFIL
jgi:hypothetical protein